LVDLKTEEGKQNWKTDGNFTWWKKQISRSRKFIRAKRNITMFNGKHGKQNYCFIPR
jgi:hypothetical protein